MPTLVTSTSRRPNLSAIVSNTSARCAGSSDLQAMPSAVPSGNCATASASGSGLRAVRITVAPSALSRRAMPSPMPRLEPVMRATWPSKRRPGCGAVAVLSVMCELQCSVDGGLCARVIFRSVCCVHRRHAPRGRQGENGDMNHLEHHLDLGPAHLFALAREAVLTWALQESAGVSVRPARSVHTGQVVDLRLDPLWPAS